MDRLDRYILTLLNIEKDNMEMIKVLKRDIWLGLLTIDGEIIF